MESNMEELCERGNAVHRAVLGDEYVDRSAGRSNEFSGSLQELIQTYCWDAVRTRSGLDRKARSLLNTAMLTALNRPRELELRLRGALTNGCTKAGISELIPLATSYCGVPARLDASHTAERVFGEPAGSPAAGSSADGNSRMNNAAETS